jgi:hypothetical protein
MATDNKIQVPFLKSMNDVLQKAISQGYTHDFMIRDGVMVSMQNENEYRAENITIENFYRFEGISDPEDNSILYVIDTHDGVKGTLVDAYGAYSDPDVDEFIKKVEDIHKKVDK